MTDLQSPKVSIIIPIYNNEKYLSRCISSVINQSLSSLEIILVDDGSIDNSPSICDQFATIDDRVLVIHKENEGVAVAENIALDMAKGQYIGFVEADDYVAQDMYEKLYKCALKTDADLVKCSFYNCAGEYRKEYKKFYGFSKEGEVFKACEKPEIFRAHPSMWAAIYRREFLNEFHIRNLITPGATYADLTWRTMVYACSRRITILPEPLYNYTSDNPESSSVKENEKCYYKTFQCRETNRILREAHIFNQTKEDAGVQEFITCYNSARRIRKDLRPTYFLKFRDVMLDLIQDGFEYKVFDSHQKRLALDLIRNNQKQFWRWVDTEHIINAIIKNPISTTFWRRMTWESVEIDEGKNNRGGIEKHSNIDVLVATHKKVDIELPEYCRLIQVGSVMHSKIDGYLHDDSGENAEENISNKNESYCELTAMFFLWKQSTAKIKGLYQYRRLFYNGEPLKCNNCRIRERARDAAKYVLTSSKIESYLENNDVIVEIPYFPGVRTVQEDLELYCYKQDIEKLDNVIQTYYPEYYETYKIVMKGYHASYCNMLIARSNIFDDYCEWLFNILDKCEDVIDIYNYDKEHKRVFGYFGEVLQNVYIKYHRLRVKQVPIMYIFEYMGHGRLPLWASWIKMWFIQICGKVNINLPTKNAPVMKVYKNEDEQTKF